MKKWFYTCAAAAALLVTGACNKEQEGRPADGEEVLVRVEVALAGTTKAGEGTLATRLGFYAYTGEGVYLPNLQPENEPALAGGAATIELRLVKGLSYRFAAIAQSGNLCTVNEDATQLTVAYENLRTSDETLDFFYGITPATKVEADDFAVRLELTRPLAMINVIASEEDLAAVRASGVSEETLAALRTSLSVTDVPTVLNLLDGTVGAPTQTVTFAPNALPTGSFAESGTWLAYAYVLAGESRTADVSFTAVNDPMNVERTFTSVPLKRNIRTNIAGYALSQTGTVTVVVDPGSDGDQNQTTPVQPEVVVTPPAGTTSPLLNPTDNSLLSEVTVALNQEDGTPGNIDFSIIRVESETTPVYTSSNTDVAAFSDTAEGLLDLKAAGTTTVTLDFPARAATRAVDESKNYDALTLTFTVTVTAPTTPDPDPDPVYVYAKVTRADALTDGLYLIVYEDGNVAFNGGLATLDVASNTIAVTISDNKIDATDDTDAAAFTLTATDKGFSIRAASGKYIGQAKDANGLASQDTALYNTLDIEDDGSAKIVASGNAVLRYNATTGQERFRYYKSSSYTNQKAIALYKRTAE